MSLSRLRFHALPDSTNAPRAAARQFKGVLCEADVNPAARALLCRLVLRLFADPLLSLYHLVKLGLMLSYMIVFRGHALVAGRHQLVRILLQVFQRLLLLG